MKSTWSQGFSQTLLLSPQHSLSRHSAPLFPDPSGMSPPFLSVPRCPKDESGLASLCHGVENPNMWFFYCLVLLPTIWACSRKPQLSAAALEGGEVAAVLLPTRVTIGGTSPLQKPSSLALLTRTHWAQEADVLGNEYVYHR